MKILTALTLALLAIAFAAFSAWLLWRAVSRGEVVSRYGGVYMRAEAPIRFWLTVSLNALTLTVFGVAALVLAGRALVPPPLAQRQSALYPTRALTLNASGRALLRCTVTPSFGVKDCSVTSEAPAGMGFGASALQISALYVIPKKDRALARPGDTLNLPIRFKMPTPPPSPPTPH